MPVLRVKVAVEKTSLFFDKLYEYVLPADMIGTAVSGCRVLVPFGPSNRKHQAVIFSCREAEDGGGLKQACALLDRKPILDAEQLELALWLADRCFCTLYEAARLMTPSGIIYRLTSALSAPLGQTCTQAMQPSQRRLFPSASKTGLP